MMPPTTSNLKNIMKASTAINFSNSTEVDGMLQEKCVLLTNFLLIYSCINLKSKSPKFYCIFSVEYGSISDICNQEYKNNK